ncbi:MAG: ribbon-helix-helix domain-containing protein [Pseudomonadota bacterium]
MCQLFVGADPDLWQPQTRSIRLDGMVTSVRLEALFWRSLETIAQRDGLTVPQLLHRLYQESLEAEHDMGNFTSFLRVCCLRYLDLGLRGLIPQDSRVALSSLDAEGVLSAEADSRHEAGAALY